MSVDFSIGTAAASLAAFAVLTALQDAAKANRLVDFRIVDGKHWLLFDPQPATEPLAFVVNFLGGK